MRMSSWFLAVLLTAAYFTVNRGTETVNPSGFRDAPMSEQELYEAATGNWGAFPDRPRNIRVPEAADPVPPSCDSQFADLEARIYREFKVEDLRKISLKIQGKAESAETEELKVLSDKFHALTPAQLNEMITLQNKAKVITRTIVRRAGYKLLNPETGTPYDALIAQKHSSDGILETSTEVRSLLILKDPRPHLTFWYNRNDPAHNPRNVVSLGIMQNKAQDYASWRSKETSQRVSGSMTDFIKSLLPPTCR